LEANTAPSEYERLGTRGPTSGAAAMMMAATADAARPLQRAPQ